MISWYHIVYRLVKFEIFNLSVDIGILIVNAYFPYFNIWITFSVRHLTLTKLILKNTSYLITQFYYILS